MWQRNNDSFSSNNLCNKGPYAKPKKIQNFLRFVLKRIILIIAEVVKIPSDVVICHFFPIGPFVNLPRISSEKKHIIIHHLKKKTPK